MYNDEKKLITDIMRRKETEINLPLFADKVMTADFEYACHKFMLNYITVKEMMADKDMADDSYIYDCIMGINKITEKYITGDCCDAATDDIEMMNGFRNKIIRKMNVLTSYTDAFELYEYILNRREYAFPENENPELEAAFEEYDAEAFADEIFRFIFSDDDKMTINARIQSMIGQLPFRMTKNKFFDILGQTLTIYNGLERGVINEFAETVSSSALIKLPDGFESEYSDLYEALEVLKSADYSELTYDSYRQLMTVLDNSAAYINEVVSDYMMIMELVNDAYVMMLACRHKENISDGCKRAVKVIAATHAAINADCELDEKTYDMLMSLEGLQEEAGEHKLMLESAVYDIMTGFKDDITALNLDDIYKDIEIIEKLISGSLFVDIENISSFDTMPADSEFIISVKDRLIAEFSQLFSDNKMVYNRAVMAKILSNIPVFFNSQDEIKEYIQYSLNHCSNMSEVKAGYVIIKHIMED